MVHLFPLGFYLLSLEHYLNNSDNSMPSPVEGFYTEALYLFYYRCAMIYHTNYVIATYCQ
jgi:hypothetical protein